MKKRGRKSAADLAVAVSEPGATAINHPEPPYELWRDEEQDVWRRVVSDVPPGWISERNFDLLAEYCTATVNARRIAQMIHHIEKEKGSLDVPEWLSLMRAHAQQSARVQSLATSMRITQQSTYTAKSGATALGDVRKGRAPWE